MALYSAMIPVIGKVASAIRRRFFVFPERGLQWNSREVPSGFGRFGVSVG